MTYQIFLTRFNNEPQLIGEIAYEHISILDSALGFCISAVHNESAYKVIPIFLTGVRTLLVSHSRLNPGITVSDPLYIASDFLYGLAKSCSLNPYSIIQVRS